MKDPRHVACRRMLEDVTRERDELVVERDHWRERYEELRSTHREAVEDVKAQTASIIEMQQRQIESLERHWDRLKDENDSYVVELAMVREGLTP